MNCVFCQEDIDSEVHNVSTKNMDIQIRNIGVETSDKGLKVRLVNVTSTSDTLQAVAEDLKYHLSCLVKVKRDTAKKAKESEIIKLKFGRVLSDVEILDSVETELNDTTRNEINATYVNLLKEYNIPVSDNPRYYKQ